MTEHCRTTRTLGNPIRGEADVLALLCGWTMDPFAARVETGLPSARPPELKTRAELPSRHQRRVDPVDVLRCHIVRRLVIELFAMAGDRDLPEAMVHRRPRCHKRQIAMYLSHVVLSVPYRTIGVAFARDRTTVVHACSVIEDRRDDRDYDHFVECCERCITAVFAPFGCDHAEL